MTRRQPIIATIHDASYEPGDVVTSVPNARRYAVACVYTAKELTDGATLLLLEIVDSFSGTVFYPSGRWSPAHVRMLQKGTYADRAAYWKARYR